MRGVTLSVVVPAYNEEEYIDACLEHLFAEIEEIDEIIVVDNNSTDSTREIVEKHAARHPKVRVLSETNQGLTYARNCGLDAATSDVIARIDADTRVNPGWASAVKEFFSRPGTETFGGVTGLNNSYDSPYRSLKRSVVDLQVRFGILGNEKRIANMHGANMALHAEAWRKIRDRTSNDPCIHEDVDLALCLVAAGYEIAQLDRMRVDVSPRRAYTPPLGFNKHVEATFATLERHGIQSVRLRMAVYAHWIAHFGAWIAYCTYDPDKQGFSIRKAMRGDSGRVLAIG